MATKNKMIKEKIISAYKELNEFLAFMCIRAVKKNDNV